MHPLTHFEIPIVCLTFGLQHGSLWKELCKLKINVQILIGNAIVFQKAAIKTGTLAPLWGVMAILFVHIVTFGWTGFLTFTSVGRSGEGEG
jgi:hypothetical protein